MKKVIRLIYWFFVDLRTAFIDNVYMFYRSGKNRGFVVCIFRGMKTEKERQEWMVALNKMEKNLSFPIINKKNII